MARTQSFLFLLLTLACTLCTISSGHRFIFKRRVIFPDFFLQPTRPASPITSTNNLVQELSAWSDADVLLSLVSEFPDLVKAASSKDPLLVFAPTNDAFLTVVKLFFPKTPKDASPSDIVKALKQIWTALLKAEPSAPTLKDILLYHIVAGDLSEFQIVKKGTLKPLKGPSLGVKSYPKIINDADKTLTSKRLGLQIRTTNGRISFISNVLIPFDVPKTLKAAGITLPLSSRTAMMSTKKVDMLFKPFRSLVDFGTRRNDIKILTTIVANDPVLLKLVRTTKALHVFAPTDTAFVDLVTAIVPKKAISTLLPKGVKATLANQKELDMFVKRLVKVIDSVSALPTVRQIVAYHILSTTASFHKLAGKGPLPTLFKPARITVTKTGVKDLDPVRPDAKKIASFGTRNGFVTIIDSVLAPASAEVIIKAIAKALE